MYVYTTGQNGHILIQYSYLHLRKNGKLIHSKLSNNTKYENIFSEIFLEFPEISLLSFLRFYSVMLFKHH